MRYLFTVFLLLSLVACNSKNENNNMSDNNNNMKESKSLDKERLEEAVLKSMQESNKIRYIGSSGSPGTLYVTKVSLIHKGGNTYVGSACNEPSGICSSIEVVADGDSFQWSAEVGR